MESTENIIFIGGIHGVGKGTICKEIASKSDLIHITASEIIKWDKISSSDNKLVENISSTQERLILGLKNLIQKDKQYLLDGHFCLLNSKGIPCKIDKETFDNINPKIISIVIDDVEKIIDRLEKRDNKKYDFKILNELQQMEIEYAKYLSKNHSIPYIEIKNNDYKSLLNSINP
ncbi:ATP-binding protein [Flavobacterium sp. SUN052]|uniref:ATP-binding protein n=1 Tax=Flavobacterium sp. SUN052 TaxID=3002441 RepID=UPI00237DCD56|nr:ATP-binding protein [Flavobacterium sp. SUN052]MEC4003587.1 ATP-binding protein [Flavobacterium sp. SUN052]